jgi:hypothetical protein
VASVPVSVRFGFGQGFQRFAEPFTQSFGQDAWEGTAIPGGRFYALADTVTDEALRQLDAAQGRRQFLWVHYFDPHSPYGDSAGGRVLTPAEVLRRMGDGAGARAGLEDGCGAWPRRAGGGPSTGCWSGWKGMGHASTRTWWSPPTTAKAWARAT